MSEWTMEELYFKYGLSVGYISFFLKLNAVEVRRHLIRIGAIGLIKTEEEWALYEN